MQMIRHQHPGQRLHQPLALHVSQLLYGKTTQLPFGEKGLPLMGDRGQQVDVADGRKTAFAKLVSI
jgi:hypothetical protein